MNLRQIEYFVMVAEEMSFTRAARRLHISQPPLSRHIRALEEELGVVLLIRTSRSMRLTGAGRVLLAEGKLLIAQAASITDRVRRTGNVSGQCVRVGFATGLGDALHLALARHLIAQPDAEVHFKSIFSSEQSQALRENVIDIGLMRAPFDPLLLQGATLFQERLTALMPQRHRLAGRSNVRLADLANETILLHKRNVSVGVYDKVMELLRNARISPKMVQTKTGPYEEAGTALVASGKGIYISGGTADVHPGAGVEVRAVPISDADATVPVCIAWRKHEQSASVNQFVESMRATLAGRG